MTQVQDSELVPLRAVASEEDESSSSSSGSSSSTRRAGPPQNDEPKLAACRICLEEDELANLEAPCSCSGSVKYTHRGCLQRWITEKGDKQCEICKQPFEGEYDDPPPPPPPRPQHVTVWGQDYLVVADPETGTIRAHRLQDLYEEEAAEEESPMHTSTAYLFTAVVLVLCMLLVRHLVTLFSMPPPGAGPAGHGAGGEALPPSDERHSGDPHAADEGNATFEDLSMTLLVLWLLGRMLVMVAPCLGIGRGGAAWGGAGGAGGQRQAVELGEVELERRLDLLIQRMEAGALVGGGTAIRTADVDPEREPEQRPQPEPQPAVAQEGGSTSHRTSQAGE